MIIAGNANIFFGAGLSGYYGLMPRWELVMFSGTEIYPAGILL